MSDHGVFIELTQTVIRYVNCKDCALMPLAKLILCKFGL